MKNDANIRNFIEISGNMHGKSRKMHGKSGNFRGIHSSKWQNRREILRSFPVVFGRFCGHFWRKSENIGEKWRKSEKSFRFHSFSFHFLPFRSSTPRFSSPNVKSYLIIRFFVVNIWVIRKFVVSLHCLKEIMI